MFDDNNITGMDRMRPSFSRDRADETLQAARYSLKRLGRLLHQWEEGTLLNSYHEARAIVLAELTTARAYLGEVEHIVALAGNNEIETTGYRHEADRLGQVMASLQEKAKNLGIINPET